MKRLIVLLVVGLVAGLTVSSPADVSAAKPKVRWRSCGGEFADFDCATFAVPLDHERPDGRQVKLALARLPATDQENKLGSLFLNPGGPGGSGVGFVLGAGPFLFSDEVRARYDLVGFDPRGIIDSDPLRCFRTFEEALSVSPRSPSRSRPTRRHSSPSWTSGSTPPVSGVAARSAITWRRRTSHAIWTCYARRSVIRCSTSPATPTDRSSASRTPTSSPTGSGRSSSTACWTRSPGRPASATRPRRSRSRPACAATPVPRRHSRSSSGCATRRGRGCAFSGDAADRYAALAAQLRAAPILIEDPETGEVFPFGYADLIGNSLGPLYDSFGWSFFAEFLAYVEAAADPAVLGVALDELMARTGAGLARNGERYPNFVEGFPSVVCSDSDNPDDHAAWAAAGAAADDEFGYFGRLWTWASSPCAVWSGFDNDRYVGPFDHETANPVLVVGTRYDPATRYEGAVTVDELLPDSALLTINGWGHTSLFLSACADAAISLYFLDGGTPVAGTECDQDFNPFALNMARASRALADRQAARAEALEHIGNLGGR